MKRPGLPRRRWWFPAMATALWLGFLFWFALPAPLFDAPLSTVIQDRSGHLLGARIAADGQWRFPAKPKVPAKFTQALIAFEDKRFFHHPGVDPVAIGRAIEQNLKAGEVVSGASTLSMQVIRLARGNQPRTLKEKGVEAILALRLELAFSKAEILALYAAHAPFGGNVVGLDAAAWRYFGRSPQQLSWAESATLAVLPNNPALVHPGRNRETLLRKRNRLLEKLHNQGHLDAVGLELAKAEPLPGAPLPLPRLAPHLLDRVHSEGSGKGPTFDTTTTLDRHLQGQVTAILQRYHRLLRSNQVHNGAILVLDTATGETLAYVGNTQAAANASTHGQAVDIITARRSTGSLLKPFLHAAMIEAGKLTPQMLLPDLPTRYGGYAPKNFDLSYSGAIAADRALASSTNVTAVRLLEAYGHGRFQALLQALGMSTLDRPADDYGLSLILGGAEGTLWEMTGMYAALGRTLLAAAKGKKAFHAPAFRFGTDPSDHSPRGLDPAAVWHTLEAMSLVERPHGQGYWQIFDSARKIAWKTGTSFGFRDAWAIGVTPQFTVGVWIGNGSGEGRPGLTGALTAAPVMFEVFAKLNPDDVWFAQPERAMTVMTMCRESGFRPNPWCPRTSPQRVAAKVLMSDACPYHEQIHLDSTGTWQVHGDCASPSTMQTKAWFTLPPGMAWFYRKRHGDYLPPPPWLHGCDQREASAMSLIYPAEPTRIRIPVELDGERGATVFEVAHRHPGKTIFWHLDDHFLGSTRDFHQMALRPNPGKHTLVLIDEDGVTLKQGVQILASPTEAGR